MHQKMADYQQPAPEVSWDLLDKTLASNKPKAKVVPMWTRRLAAAVVAAVIVVSAGYLMLRQQDEDTMAIVSQQKTDILHPENISHLNGFASIWCSIENLFLAATAEGYACNLRIPLGDEEEHARKVLGFPDDYFMPCFIGIGRPKKEAATVRQNRVDLKERIHWNRF